MTDAENTDISPINSVNMARTVVLGTTTTGFAYTGQSNDTTTSNVDTANVTVELTNDTTITAVRGMNDGFTLDIPVQSLEFRGPLKSA